MDPSLTNPSESQLAASLLVIQLVIAVSVIAGFFVSRYWRYASFRSIWHEADAAERTASGMVDISILAVWLILTWLILALTTFSLSGWQTLGFNPPELGVRTATLIAFWLDLGLATWFVSRSGGWADSPFTSILAAVPTFAILLNESLPRIAGYVSFVIAASAVFFYLSSQARDTNERRLRDRQRLNFSNWLLTSIMLGLTAWIGLFGAK